MLSTSTHLPQPKPGDTMRTQSQRLLCVCLSWSLLLLQVLRTATQDLDDDDTVYEYGGTPLPDFESNTTIEFTFFSNVSNFYDEFHKILYGTEDVTQRTEEVEEEGQDAGWGPESGASGTFPPSILLGLSLMALWLGQHL